MRTPTAAEVKLGYDGITADGPRAQITADLSMLVITDPNIADTISRMLRAANALGAEGGPHGLLRGLVSGALVYGLHLGLCIGEARAEISRAEEPRL